MLIVLETFLIFLIIEGVCVCVLCLLFLHEDGTCACVPTWRLAQEVGCAPLSLYLIYFRQGVSQNQKLGWWPASSSDTTPRVHPPRHSSGVTDICTAMPGFSHGY